MSLDFFEQFANSIDIGVNKNIVNNDEKNNKKNIEKSDNLEKKMSVLSLDDEKKKNMYKCIHGKNILMLCGQYKGYTGFVYEYFPKTVSLMLDEEQYVMCSDYRSNDIGDEIMTIYGKGKIVSRVEKLYEVGTTGGDIRLPRSYFTHYVIFMEDGNFIKVGEVMREVGCEYDIRVVSVSMKTKDVDCLMKKLLEMSKIEYENEKRIVKMDCIEELYMVNQKSSNKNDKNYFGKYGKLLREIPQQFLVMIKSIVRVKESMCLTNGKNVKVKFGLYKNKSGDLVDIEEAYMNVNIEPIGKFITNHYIMKGDKYAIEKILPSHVFYMDLQLKNGNYYQVNNYDGKIFTGIEKVGNLFVEKTIKRCEIERMMCGFTIISSMEGVECEIDSEKIEKFSMELDDIKETNEKNCEEIEQEIEDSKDDIDYGVEMMETDDYVYDDKQGEMKETFKDFERLGFAEKSFSKEEKEYMKMIEKCCEKVGDIDTNEKYDLLEKVSDAVKLLKDELVKREVTDWKNTDIKYVVACLIFRVYIKKSINVTIYDYKNFIGKLYDGGFLTKDSIMGSVFLLQCEKSLDDSPLKLLELSNEKLMFLKKNYKEKKYDEIINHMMEKCFKLMNVWFENIEFGIKKVEMNWIPIAKPNTIRQYPKYFLTTNDIVNDKQFDTAKRLMWGPESKKLINIWKMSLNDKLKNESNDIVKKIYEFIIDNIENAPFVLKELEGSDNKLDKLKYKELKRTFDIFTSKLKSYVEKKEDEKRCLLDRKKYEKVVLNQKREHISKMSSFE